MTRPCSGGAAPGATRTAATAAATCTASSAVKSLPNYGTQNKPGGAKMGKKLSQNKKSRKVTHLFHRENYAKIGCFSVFRPYDPFLV